MPYRFDIFAPGGGHEIPPYFEIISRVTGILRTIGIPANLLGYMYVREAVAVALRDPGAINAVTKIIYPAVAQTFGTTPSRVERNIRSAIESAWNRGDIDTKQSFFGSVVSYITGKPTNAEFIAVIAEHIRFHAA